MKRLVSLALGAALLLVVGAPPVQAETLHVYSSLPLHGAPGAAARGAERGMRAALREAGGRAGVYDIRYRSLDDWSRWAGNWDPGEVARNARRAWNDDRTILFLGNFNSGASAISIPILNQANIPQISPSNTYNGLTTSEAGSERGEPRKYYPTGRRTYFRMTPRDTVQSAALLTEMAADDCDRVLLADDGDTYGHGVTTSMVRQSSRVGVRVVARVGNADRKRPARLRKIAARSRADCFLFGGVTANRAPRIYKAVAGRLPDARLYGSDGVCESGFTRRVSFSGRFECTIATMPVSAFPGGAAFMASYRLAFASAKITGYEIFGYEAMKLGLDTIAALRDRGNRREAVRRTLLQTSDRASVLGTYSIDKRGDNTLRRYGIYRVSGHRIQFDHAVDAR